VLYSSARKPTKRDVASDVKWEMPYSRMNVVAGAKAQDITEAIRDFADMIPTAGCVGRSRQEQGCNADADRASPAAVGAESGALQRVEFETL
jgi:hypothetical protein